MLQHVVLPVDVVKRIRSGKQSQLRFPHRGPCKLKIGKAYAVKTARDKPAVFSITVLAISEQFMAELTLKDARRCGYRSTAEYWDDHPSSLNTVLNTLVDVVDFDLGDTTDKPRLLAARSGRGDYVTSTARAMHGSGEEVSADIQDRYAMQGRELHELTIQQLQYGLSKAVEDYLPHASSPAQHKRLKTIKHLTERL